MKVLSAHINWMEGWSNLPDIEVTVDKMADGSQLHYRTHSVLGVGTLYWAEVPDTPFVRFFHHSPSNEHGYGGREFSGFLANDGARFIVKGPWSSNAMVMNAHFPMVTSIHIKERDGQFPSLGYHGFAMRVGDAAILIEQEGASVALINTYGGGDNEVTGTDILARAILDREYVAGKYDIAIKMKSMTLVESQKAKRKVSW